jgi:hypothetical protein
VEWQFKNLNNDKNPNCWSQSAFNSSTKFCLLILIYVICLCSRSSRMPFFIYNTTHHQILINVAVARAVASTSDVIALFDS